MYLKYFLLIIGERTVEWPDWDIIRLWLHILVCHIHGTLWLCGGCDNHVCECHHLCVLMINFKYLPLWLSPVLSCGALHVNRECIQTRSPMQWTEQNVSWLPPSISTYYLAIRSLTELEAPSAVSAAGQQAIPYLSLYSTMVSFQACTSIYDLSCGYGWCQLRPFYFRTNAFVIERPP